MKAQIFLSLAALLAGCGGSNDPDGGGGSNSGGSDTGGTFSGGGSGGGAPSGGASSGGSSGGGAALEVPNYPTRITSGDDHTCVIVQGSSISCWGNTSSNIITAPAGEYVHVAAIGDTTCGVDTAGGVVCWGDDTTVTVGEPGAADFKHVGITNGGACALNGSGAIACWGLAETNGGAGILENAPADGGYDRLIRGSATLCAVKAGQPTCWGYLPTSGNPTGPLDSADRYGSWCSVVAGALDCMGGGVSGHPLGNTVAQVVVGDTHACAISETGNPYCWGLDPITPPTDVKFLELSAGKGHSCGITVDGDVRCWGTGAGADVTVPAGIKVF